MIAREITSETNQQLLKEIEALKKRIGELENSQNESQYQSLSTQVLLDATMDSYVVADAKGNISDINQAYCDLVGYSKEELRNMNIRQLEANTPPEEVDRRIREIMSKGKDRFETRHKHKNGKIQLKISRLF